MEDQGTEKLYEALSNGDFYQKMKKIMDKKSTTTVNIPQTTYSPLYSSPDSIKGYLGECSSGIMNIGATLEQEYGLIINGSRKETRYSLKTNLGIEFKNIKKPNVFHKLSYFFLGWILEYDPKKCDPTDCKNCSKKVACALRKQ